MIFKNKFSKLVVLLTSLFSVSYVLAQDLVESDNPLTLSAAINLAQKTDPWLNQSHSKQTQLTAMAISAGQLPDPQMSVGLANLGADRFDFNQEPMTQLKVGVAQMFPRGKTRVLKQDQLTIQASQQVWLRANREAQVAMETSQLWLKAYQAQQSILLIEQNRSLFDQLVDWVDASYSSGYGQARQQDLIQAQLEVTRLEDRLTQLKQEAELALNQLQQYIGSDMNHNLSTIQVSETPYSIGLANEMPDIKTSYAPILNEKVAPKLQNWIAILQKHPTIMALDVDIDAAKTGVDLAQQKYKPAWGLNASYGYRADGDNRVNRADLLSVGVTFDLPIFTGNRQDQDVKAAVANEAALESEKLLLLRKLKSAFMTEKSQLSRLQQRLELFEHSLLPQLNQQAEATLSAYTNDDGDFTDVIRARISELDALIDSLAIQVNMALTQVKLNYLLVGTENIPATSGDSF